MNTSVQVLHVVRRLPKQARAGVRIHQIVKAAEKVIARKGVLRATMTEIAVAANASIGSIYQYFPNKELLVEAIRAIYIQEIDRSLSGLAIEVDVGQKCFSEEIVDLLVSFAEKHCAFRHLFFTSEFEFKSVSDDMKLVNKFCSCFGPRCMGMSHIEIRDITETSLLIIKGVLDTGERLGWDGHMRLIREGKHALHAYLASRRRYSKLISR